MVSIIIPVYNMAEYLQDTLDSIVPVKSHVEVVVMDDGSTDGSFAIAQEMAKKDNRFRVYQQANAGVSAARNHAIRMAQGEYILPLDGDDCIAAEWIGHAAELLERDEDVRVVGGKTYYMGEKTGEWIRPKFSKALLARKNMLPATCMYRKKDWEKTGGYCEEEIYREDWDMWLSLMEQGGEYVELEEVSLYYRIRKVSRRMNANAKKHKIKMIDMLNQRHESYFRTYLDGPLHYHRSWSKWLNKWRKETIVGKCKDWYGGQVIRAQRNTLRLTEEGIIKDFQRPNVWKAVLYGMLRKSKARRSYEYALRLGEWAPKPIAYREVRVMGMLRECQYLSEYIAGAYTYEYMMCHPDEFDVQGVIRQIAILTAKLHDKGILHKDYSRGNILFDKTGEKIWLVDLNRIRWGKQVSIAKGVKNLERLREITDESNYKILKDTYIEHRECKK